MIKDMNLRLSVENINEALSLSPCRCYEVKSVLMTRVSARVEQTQPKNTTRHAFCESQVFKMTF